LTSILKLCTIKWVDELRKFRFYFTLTEFLPSTESVFKATNMKRKENFVAGKAISHPIERNQKVGNKRVEFIASYFPYSVKK
jgi:hypothetical protein